MCTRSVCLHSTLHVKWSIPAHHVHVNHFSLVSIICCQSIFQSMDWKHCIDLDCKTETRLSSPNYCWAIGYGPSRKQAEDLCSSFPSLMVWQGEEWPSPYLFHFWVLIDGPFYKWLPQDLSSVKECIETLCAFQLTVVTYRKCGKTYCIRYTFVMPQVKHIGSVSKPCKLQYCLLPTSEAAQLKWNLLGDLFGKCYLGSTSRIDITHYWFWVRTMLC